MPTNPFDNLGGPTSDLNKASPLEASTNPFNNLSGKNLTGMKPIVTPESNFSKMERFSADAKTANDQATKMNTFGSKVFNAINPISNAKAAFDLSKTVIANPKQAANQAALGFANGITLGATDFLQRKAFVDTAKKYGLSDEQARQMADTTLQPQDPNLAAIRGGTSFAGMVAPYAGFENLMIKGLAYAAPGFVGQYAKTAKLLVDIGAFNAAGQTIQTFLPKEKQNRVQQALLDTATAGAFNLGGAIFRAIRGTPFKSPFEVNPVVNTNALIPHDTVITGDNLMQGAKERIAELQGKAFLRGNEAKDLKFLKDNANNPDALYQYNAAPPKADVPVPDAKASAKIKTGPIDAKTGEPTGPEMNVATNDLSSLQDYIKGSGKIDYKIVDNLGKDAKGNDIQARHEFNNDTGIHTIYTTDKTTASNLAHELGHYFDTKLTQSTEKFSSMLPDIEKNRGAIEDTLGSFATDRLGGEATSEQISKEISDSVKKMNQEIDLLSSQRRGKLIASPSEKFADAVSEIATKDGAKDQAPTLTALLQHAEKMDTVKLFGETVAKELKTSSVYESAAKATENMAPKIPKDVINVNGKSYQLSGKALEDFKKADAEFKSRNELYKNDNTERGQAARKGIGMEYAAKKRMITGELTQTEINNAVKRERSNFVGKNVEVTINGKKVPATIESKPAYGNTKVKLTDGRVMSVKNTAIAEDVRKVEDIISKITSREGVKPYEAPGTPISKLVSHEDTDAKRVAQYKKDIEAGKELDPIKIVDEGNGKFGVEDGKNKLEAYRELGYKEVPTEDVTANVKERSAKAQEKLALDRGETGKKPSSENIRAEKMTNDAANEKFIKEKVLPNVTGKERIGRSNEDIAKQAFSSDLTQESFDKILSERVGNLSSDVVKAKQIIADSALSLQNKLAGRDLSELSGQELKDAMSDYSKLVQTFEVFAGVRTELSNSFRSLGIGVNPGENDVLHDALAVIQKALGGETDPFQIMKKAVQLQSKGPVAKYFEIWYSALLSGPKTTARNVFGNTSNLTADIFSNAFTKQGRKEIFPMISAIINGQKEAFNKAVAVFKGEEDITSKFYEPGVPMEKTFKGKMAFLNKIEYVGRFLNAQDMYFNSIAKDAEIAAQRVGDFSYGLENPDLAKSVNESVAKAYGQNVTFRNQFEHTFVGEIGKMASGLKNSKVSSVRMFGNFFVPFVKTVSNITDRRIDFMPILNIARTFGARELYEQRAGRVLKDAGLFNSLFEDGLAKNLSNADARAFADGEVSRIKEIIIDRLRNKQMGKFYMGMAVMAAGAPLAITGRITGNGPKSKAQRDTLLASGWRPNSIIMPNGVALPYQNLATPLASIFSILGNLSDSYKYNDTGSNHANIVDASFGFMKSELDQSFLTGISNLYDGMTGYKSKEQVLSNLAANGVPIPAAWNQTKDIIFPEQYNATKFGDIIKNKLGITGDFFGTGLTEPLQPKLDAFGNQVKSDLIYGLTPPLLNSKTDDPVLNFMLAENVNVSKPNMGNKIKGRHGEERPMTPEEYTTFVKESGAKAYDQLKMKVDSGYFDKFKTKKEKQDAVDAIVKKIRAGEKSNIRY